MHEFLTQIAILRRDFETHVTKYHTLQTMARRDGPFQAQDHKVTVGGAFKGAAVVEMTARHEDPSSCLMKSAPTLASLVTKMQGSAAAQSIILFAQIPRRLQMHSPEFWVWSSGKCHRTA